MDIFEFVKECERFCKTADSCGECPIEHCHKTRACEITDKDIAFIKDWSEKHPAETYCSFVRKYFPDFSTFSMCPSYLGLKDSEYCGCDQDCKDCWNRPFPDDEKEALLKKQRKEE